MVQRNRLAGICIGKRSLYFVFFCYALLWSSCSKNEVEPIHIPTDEILTTDIHLIPDKHTKKATTVLTFKNLNAIAYISVKKSGGSTYSAKINRDELSASYTFGYTIQPSDPESFDLLLTAHYEDEGVSKDLVLHVDNRWGFFIRKVERIARVTGNPIAGEHFASPNNTAGNWNVGGTDLGIIWEMDAGKYGIFFGDTFGQDFVPRPNQPGPNGGSWRSNVLAFSTDNNMEDGLSISNMALDNSGNAREIVYGGKDQSGNGNWTSIPTAAIRANGADYVHYFNMKRWDGWITNYSGMYKSVDNGLTWTKCEDVLFSSNSNFGQGGYFKRDGYVYMIGTQTGRNSPASLCRFRETDIETQENYEYWSSATGQWIKGDEHKATVIIQDKVGELSFIYSNTFKKWIIAYFNEDRYNITMRVADELTGPWSTPYELASGNDYAQLYGSYFHPLSVTGESLYFTMSMWMPYNVYLMKADLADMGLFSE